MAKAAAHLGISQPAVSEVVANLEHTLGAPLFDRSPRGVETTIYGRALLRRSRAAFDELKQGVRDVEFLSDPTSGELRIACSNALSASILPPIIDVFSKAYPRVVIHVQALPPATPELSGLHDRKYDLALGRLGGPLALNPLGDDVNVEALFDDRLIVAAGAKSPWVARRKIDLAELIDEPWVLGDADSWRYTRLLEAFHVRGIAMPKISIVTASVHVIAYLLASGRFITVISQALADQHALKVLPVALPKRPSPIVVATLKNRTLSALAERFIQHAREVTKLLASGDKRAGRQRHGLVVK